MGIINKAMISGEQYQTGLLCSAYGYGTKESWRKVMDNIKLSVFGGGGDYWGRRFGRP
ncbi:hypothetical protein [Candidatus Magnetominusculus dajiuhuensis]|uniref:hypothetical protein n=1 Tax=Candidatus Magnetominusculus dajiuhuensis TaxID=3137712 RepID=UPI003B42F107